MAVLTGRTVQKYNAFYMGGYNFTGYINQLGPALWEYDTPGLPALDDAMQGGLPNESTISLGEVKGIFDNTATSGLHAVLAAGTGVSYVVTVGVGIRNSFVDATGHPTFCGRFVLDQYRESGDDGMLSAMLKFGAWDAGALIAYDQPWGTCIGVLSTATANTSTGYDLGAASTAGGYMTYHVLGYGGAGGATATLSVDDAATNTNPSFSALSGCTTGSIDVSTLPSGIVAISKTATVRQYVRWQLALGTATSVQFVMSFVRGR